MLEELKRKMKMVSVGRKQRLSPHSFVKNMQQPTTFRKQFKTEAPEQYCSELNELYFQKNETKIAHETKDIKAINKKRKLLLRSFILRRNNDSTMIQKLTINRMSRADKENINRIIRNSIVSSSKNHQCKMTNRQSEIINNQFNIKFKEIKKKKNMHKTEEDKDHHQVSKIQSYSATKIGTKHTQNQDSIEHSDYVFVVCDGHGANGRDVSRFVCKYLHYKTQQALMQSSKFDVQTIKQIFKSCEKELDTSTHNIAFSGCTALLIVVVGINIYCACVGDSSALRAYGIKTEHISIEHKPGLDKERQRIQGCGGVIRKTEVSKDKYAGPLRIWAPGKTSWGPGLALSRAFGDKAAKRYGIISEPDILVYSLTYNVEQYIVMGSDGLFDFMSDQQISSFVKKCLRQNIGKQDICSLLINEAEKKWGENSDDISCILIFL